MLQYQSHVCVCYASSPNVVCELPETWTTGSYNNLKYCILICDAKKASFGISVFRPKRRNSDYFYRNTYFTIELSHKTSLKDTIDGNTRTLEVGNNLYEHMWLNNDKFKWGITCLNHSYKITVGDCTNEGLLHNKTSFPMYKSSFYFSRCERCGIVSDVHFILVSL